MSKFRFLSVVMLAAAVLSIIGLVGLAGNDQPQYGGTLVIPAPYASSFSTLDNIRTGETQNMIVIREILQGLVKLDTNGKPVPAVAESWDVSQDGTVYTFHLRHGVKFQNGREVKAADFQYSFERLMDPKEAAQPVDLLQDVVGVKAYQAGTAKHISGIKVIDDYTLQITLKSINVDFLYNLAQVGAEVVPQEVVKKLGRDFGLEPVGCGPFKFVSWKGNVIVLEAFKDYYGGRPYVDKLIFQAMGESSAMAAAFDAKDIDLNLVTVAQYAQYKKSMPQLLVEAPELYTRLIGFNMEWGPFKDKRVRQAFNYAIDKKTVVEKYLQGKAYTATGYFPPSMSAYNPTLKGYTYDPAKAKELLKEAGYPNGFEVEILGTGNLSWGIPAVEAVAPYLEAVGIKVKPTQLESGTMYDRITKGDFQAFIWSLGGYASPVLYINRYTSTHSRAAGNLMAYKNPAFDTIMGLASNEMSFDERMDLLRAAEAVFVDDPPCWFFNYNRAVIVHQPWVHGLQPVGREMMYQPWEKVWIDSTSPRASN